jgi:hypothetical protein
MSKKYLGLISPSVWEGQELKKGNSNSLGEFVLRCIDQDDTFGLLKETEMEVNYLLYAWGAWV